MTSGSPLFSIVLWMWRGTGGSGVLMQIETSSDHAAAIVPLCIGLKPDWRNDIQEAATVAGSPYTSSLQQQVTSTLSEQDFIYKTCWAENII